MKTRYSFCGAALSLIALSAAGTSMPCHGQNNNLLPKMPVSIAGFELDDQRIHPMPLDERMRRGVVPQRGLVSTVPGQDRKDFFMSGNESCKSTSPVILYQRAYPSFMNGF